MHSCTKNNLRILITLLFLITSVNGCELNWTDSFDDAGHSIYYNVTIEPQNYAVCNLALGMYYCATTNETADTTLVNMSITGIGNGRNIYATEFNYTQEVYFSIEALPFTAIYRHHWGLEDFDRQFTRWYNDADVVLKMTDMDANRYRIILRCNGTNMPQNYTFNAGASDEFRNFSYNYHRTYGENLIHTQLYNGSDWYYMGNCTSTGATIYKPFINSMKVGGVWEKPILNALLSHTADSRIITTARYEVKDISGIPINNATIQLQSRSALDVEPENFITNQDGYGIHANGSILVQEITPVCGSSSSLLLNRVGMPDLTSNMEYTSLDIFTALHDIVYEYDYYEMGGVNGSTICFNAKDINNNPIETLNINLNGFYNNFNCLTNTSGECCKLLPNGNYKISSIKDTIYPLEVHKTVQPIYEDQSFNIVRSANVGNVTLDVYVSGDEGEDLEDVLITYIHCPSRTGFYEDYYRSNPSLCIPLAIGTTDATGDFTSSISKVDDEILIEAKLNGYITGYRTIYINQNIGYNVVMSLQSYSTTTYNYTLLFIDSVTKTPIADSVSYTITDKNGNTVLSDITVDADPIVFTYNQTDPIDHYLEVSLFAMHDDYESEILGKTYLYPSVVLNVELQPLVFESDYVYFFTGYLLDSDDDVINNVRIDLTCDGGYNEYELTTAGLFEFTNIKHGKSCTIKIDTAGYKLYTQKRTFYANTTMNITLTTSTIGYDNVEFTVYENSAGYDVFLENARVTITGGLSCSSDKYGKCWINDLILGNTYKYETTLKDYNTASGNFNSADGSIYIKLTPIIIEKCSIYGYVYYQNSSEYGGETTITPVKIDDPNKVKIELYKGGLFTGDYRSSASSGYYSIDLECNTPYTVKSVYNDFVNEEIKLEKSILVESSNVKYDIIFSRFTKKTDDIITSMMDMVYLLSDIFPLIALLIVMGIVMKAIKLVQ